ncbi:hypothetical protein AAHZ94_14225 [Streptomyces sp. HSW2009]|uniref:hypothetical protein n=1 Tax=Streptomyces sp. HSW2009 TaxID=3142890 RepID=UPI0032EE6862
MPWFDEVNPPMPEMSFAQELRRIAGLVRFDEGEYRGRAIADIPWLVCAMQESVAWTWFPRLVQTELVEACELSARLILSGREGDRLARWVLAQAMDRAAGICEKHEPRTFGLWTPVTERAADSATGAAADLAEAGPPQGPPAVAEGAGVRELPSIEELLNVAMSPGGAVRPVDCLPCSRLKGLLDDALHAHPAPAVAQVVDAMQVHMVLGHGVQPPPAAQPS